MEPIFGSGNWPQVMRDVTAWRYASVNATNPLPNLPINEQLFIQGERDEYLIPITIVQVRPIFSASTFIQPI
jgi:hypothetical protein